MTSTRRIVGTLLCVLAWVLAACVAYVGAVYLFGVLWMHVPLALGLPIGAALAAIPILLCRACYRIGVRLRKSEIPAK